MGANDVKRNRQARHPSARQGVEEELHRLTQQLIRARDEERRHMARELHESAGQTLAALKMSLGRLRDALPETDAKSHRLLAAAIGFAEDAVREVRTISYLMHPPMLDEAGLLSAVRWLARGFSDRSGISVDVRIPEDLGRCAQEVELTVFRIVQEALTNIHRYSGSRTASIEIAQRERWIYAEIHDDGCGLPMLDRSHTKNPTIGVGIAGMRERVLQLKGQFEIESTAGTGTTVRARLPLKNA